MKTRIISAAVLIAIVLTVIITGKFISPIIISEFCVLLCVFAIYEILHNAAGIVNKWALFFAFAFGAIRTLSFCEIEYSYYFGVVYALIVVVLSLVFHKEIGIREIALLFAAPYILGYAFGSLSYIAGHTALFYLFSALNCACICDTGAYFVGVTIGKHKLCPEISPKKTVEGAIGGVVSALLVGVILFFCFGKPCNIFVYLIATVLLSICGMIGDLFASTIKRSVNIKDYSNLIPGHGGILDRTDSILLIAAVMYFIVDKGII